MQAGRGSVSSRQVCLCSCAWMMIMLWTICCLVLFRRGSMEIWLTCECARLWELHAMWVRCTTATRTHAWISRLAIHASTTHTSDQRHQKEETPVSKRGLFFIRGDCERAVRGFGVYRGEKRSSHLAHAAGGKGGGLGGPDGDGGADGGSDGRHRG